MGRVFHKISYCVLSLKDSRPSVGRYQAYASHIPGIRFGQVIPEDLECSSFFEGQSCLQDLDCFNFCGVFSPPPGIPVIQFEELHLSERCKENVQFDVPTPYRTQQWCPITIPLCKRPLFMRNVHIYIYVLCTLVHMFRHQANAGGKYSPDCSRPKLDFGWQACVEQRGVKRRHTEARFRVVFSGGEPHRNASAIYLTCPGHTLGPAPNAR